MEALAALRLNLSPKRYRPSSNKFYEDESAPSSPYYMSAPTSPRGSSLREVEEAPLGEVHAAVPFDWELKPGTPKRGNRGSREDGDITDGEDPELCRSPSPERLSRQSSTGDFDFSSARFIVEEDNTHALSNDVPIASADQLFFHGQLLPLRLPPRLQAVKHLGESDGTTIHESFRRPVSPRSGHSPVKFMSFRGRSNSPYRRAPDEEVERSGHSPVKFMSFRGRSNSPYRRAPDEEVERSGNSPVKFMSFRGRSKSPQRRAPDEEVELKPKSAKLQTFRSLSPLRIFRRENSEVSILFSDKSISGCDSASSSSSAFSASSSGYENSNVEGSKEFWPSLENEHNGRRTLSDFLFLDKPCASPKIDVSKLSSKELLSKAERFKESVEGLKSVPSKKELEAAKAESPLVIMGLTPQLSRSNARSFSRTPVKASPVLTKSKQERVLSSNPVRFGILRRCLGYAPPSPRPSL